METGLFLSLSLVLNGRQETEKQFGWFLLCLLIYHWKNHALPFIVFSSWKKCQYSQIILKTYQYTWDILLISTICTLILHIGRWNFPEMSEVLKSKMILQKQITFRRTLSSLVKPCFLAYFLFFWYKTYHISSLIRPLAYIGFSIQTKKWKKHTSNFLERANKMPKFSPFSIQKPKCLPGLFYNYACSL